MILNNKKRQVKISDLINMIPKFFKVYQITFILCFLILSSNVSLAQRFEIIPMVTLSTPSVGTYTVPTSTTLGPDEYVDEIEVDIIIVGGGGGGGRGEGAGGGGGGQVVSFTINASAGDTFSYTVGAGGLGSVIDGDAGLAGESTSFDTEIANLGLGGEGGDAGGGGNSGSATSRGVGVSRGGNRRAGGGGGGASDDGSSGTVSDSGQPTAIGGNGGDGLFGYGGGGGGSATSSNNQTQGSGVDGGTNGSSGSASNASNGGGGGGGAIEGGNGGDGLVIISATLIILPVEYAYINVSFDDKSRTAHITWATFKEWENSHFEIERAINNVTTFENIAKIEGVGYSDVLTDYGFTDKNLPLIGSMAYYRLKQMNFSGSFAYSETVGLRIPQVGTSIGVWRAYPNPTLDYQLRIALLDRSRYDGEQISFRIAHPMVTTQAITVNSENEMNEQLANLIPRIPKGLMVVEIQWGQNVEYIKVLRK